MSKSIYIPDLFLLSQKYHPQGQRRKQNPSGMKCLARSHGAQKLKSQGLSWAPSPSSMLLPQPSACTAILSPRTLDAAGRHATCLLLLFHRRTPARSVGSGGRSEGLKQKDEDPRGCRGQSPRPGSKVHLLLPNCLKCLPRSIYLSEELPQRKDWGGVKSSGADLGKWALGKGSLV